MRIWLTVATGVANPILNNNTGVTLRMMNPHTFSATPTPAEATNPKEFTMARMTRKEMPTRMSCNASCAVLSIDFKEQPFRKADFTNLVTRYHKRNREVAFYANQLSITPDYLNKVCKMHWNTSAKENIDWQVIMAIKNYLTCTSLSIKEIAVQLNYDNPSYMCRFFRKITGKSPLEYRNSRTESQQNSLR